MRLQTAIEWRIGMRRALFTKRSVHGWQQNARVTNPHVVNVALAIKIKDTKFTRSIVGCLNREQRPRINPAAPTPAAFKEADTAPTGERARDLYACENFIVGTVFGANLQQPQFVGLCPKNQSQS